VWLGEPLLEWTLGDLADDTWVSSAYEIMKRFLAIARREYQLLTLGPVSGFLSHAMNLPPVSAGAVTPLKRGCWRKRTFALTVWPSLWMRSDKVFEVENAFPRKLSRGAYNYEHYKNIM